MKRPRPLCTWPGCDRPFDRNALCDPHASLLYRSGMTLDALLALWTPTCAIEGCEAPATDLDHDHWCCHVSISPDRPHRHATVVVQRRMLARCGECNRGFICRSHNVAIREAEARNLYDPPIRQYLARANGSYQHL